MSDFLKFCLAPLLAYPDDLIIEESASGISLKVNSEDAGRVIGRGGSVIMALRSLLTTYCANHNLPSVQVTLIN